MNATFDEVEKEWKASEVGNTVGDRTFYEAHFHHSLAARLDLLGYGIRRTEQHFEFASVSRELVEKFSRRTELRIGGADHDRVNETSLSATARPTARILSIWSTASICCTAGASFESMPSFSNPLGLRSAL
jgi:TrwC relaxase